MHWNDLEKAFNRAILLSASRKKLALTFPILVLCGILSVFCKAVSFESGEWVSMSLAFFPILFSSGIMLALGVLVIRMHHHEAKNLALDFRKLIGGSIDLIVGISYLSILPILAYLFLWTLLGIFFLLQEVPVLGDFFSVVFSFGPFLLIFGSLLLCLFNLGLLFFVAPAAALQPLKKHPPCQKGVECPQPQALHGPHPFVCRPYSHWFCRRTLKLCRLFDRCQFFGRRALSLRGSRVVLHHAPFLRHLGSRRRFLL